jgi:hypothetical protein
MSSFETFVRNAHEIGERHYSSYLRLRVARIARLFGEAGSRPPRRHPTFNGERRRNEGRRQSLPVDVSGPFSISHAATHHRLKQVPKNIAITEAAITVLGEGRMVRHDSAEIQSAVPSIGQVQMDVLSQTPLRPNAKTQRQSASRSGVPDQEGRPVAVELPVL